jgi:HEAT repeat protein
MLSGRFEPHQQMMPDASSPHHASATLAIRFARLVALVAAQPAAVAEHRPAVRALAKALAAGSVELTCDADGVLCADGAAVVDDDAEAAAALAFLGARLHDYGVDALTLGRGAAEADLSDLARLLATAPTQADPQAFFAARAAAVDARSIPRRLRARAPEPPAAAEPEPEPVVAAPPEPEVDPEPSADARSELLTEALAIPESADPEQATLFRELAAATAADALRPLLEQLTLRADLAFRTGAFDALVESMAALIAIEFQQLARDESEDWRREFSQAVRRLAKPVILRQLAVLRHVKSDNADVAARVQAILYRYGTDGAAALIDEWANAPSLAARGVILQALRGLRRTHDSLFEMVRDTREPVVRQALEILGLLGDVRSEQLVIEQLRHPEPRTRRAVAAALERFPSVGALDALGLMLLDESAMVRARAVAALIPRGPAALKLLAPLLETEPEREVLYGVIAAVGRIGTPDGVQLLIRAAQGETAHPQRRAAAYRLQACSALVLIRTPQAMAAVQALRDDRDRDVREGSQRLVAQAARRNTTSMRAITA